MPGFLWSSYVFGVALAGYGIALRWRERTPAIVCGIVATLAAMVTVRWAIR